MEMKRMALPFERIELTTRNVGVMRGRGSVTLCAIENLLAQAAGVREVTPVMVASLCEERRVDLPNRLTRGRRQLYARYLKHCFEDRRLSDHERADLAHLRELLHLSRRELAVIQDQVAIEIYGEVIQEVLADFQIDEDESAFLTELRAELGLEEERAEKILEEGTANARMRARSQAQARDQQFLEHRTSAGDFTGRSEQSLDCAIQDALTKASLAVPKLHWFEVLQIAGYVSDGRASGWHVNLRAGIHKDEIG
jgi:flavin-binding protein dodecin